MLKVKQNKVWLSRTCPISTCGKRFASKKMLGNHMTTHQPPAPTPENQSGLVASTTEYSPQKLISDLENQNRKLRHFAVEAIASIVEQAMRVIR